MPFSLRTAGTGLHAFLGTAFTHLVADSGEPTVQIGVWDGASTGVAMPAPAWNAGDTISHGFLPSLSDSATSVFYDTDRRDFLVVDTRIQEAYRWLAEAGGLPDHERAAPMRQALQSLLRPRGVTVCHAAAVGMGTRGLLVVGPGGHGKSTVALTCLAAGWSYAGDDYVGVSAAPPSAHSLYGSAKVDAGFAGGCPSLAEFLPGAQGTSTGKLLLWPGIISSGRMARSLRITAIVVPRVSGEDRPRVEPGRSADALKALAPTSLFQSERPSPADFRVFAELSRTVPVYRLSLGGRPDLIPAVLEPVL